MPQHLTQVVEADLQSLQLDEDFFDDDVRSSTGTSRTQFQGLRVLAFVTNTPVCKSALVLAKSFLAGKCIELTLCYVAPNPYSFEGMRGVLEGFAEGLSGFKVRTELVEKREDQTLVEALVEFAAMTNPDLIILGSTSLCNDARMEEAAAKAKRNSHSGSISVHSSKPSRQAFSMKLCQAMRNVPLLVVKANSRGGFFSYQGTTNVPLKFMVDLQPTSRHMLAWLMNIMDSGKDALYLAVSKAYDAAGVTKQVAVRMITSFSVQASVNKFKPERRLFKDAAEKALPQAVAEDEVDVLMVQAPRSKDLSPYIVNLLCSAATSILIWPPEADSNALGQKPAPVADADERPSTSSGSMRGVSRSSSISHDGGTPQPSPRPASRSSMYSGSGTYTYSYASNAAPQMDDATKAAMDAMADRMARRKAADDKAAASAANAQRSRAGAYMG